MNARKSVLLLIPTFADEGGTQKMVYELGRLLAEKYKVYECAFDAFHEPHIFKTGNEVLSLGSGFSSSFIQKMAGYPLKAWRLRRLKKKYAIDITISNLWAADLVNALSAGHGKMVSIGHVNIVGNFQNRLLLRIRRLASLVYNRFDKVVAVNKYLKEELQELFALPEHKATYINNFIVLPQEAPAPIPKPAGKKRLVNFGRLNPIKNHEPLIALCKSIGSVQLVLMGAGPLQSSLQAYARSLDLQVSNDLASGADVIFTGFHPDPYSVLCASDLFVFSSRSEGFGLVLVEAMHAGLPVVTSDCPTGGPHVILEGNGRYEQGRKTAEETPYGYLMPIPERNDREGLRLWQQVITALLSDERKRNGQSAHCKKRARDFSREQIKGQWFDLLDHL